MKNWMALALFVFASTASAGQIFPENSPWPECFVGNPETALQELIKGNYNPAFSAEQSWFDSDLVVGVQVDGHGQSRASFLERCE